MSARRPIVVRPVAKPVKVTKKNQPNKVYKN
jgi:hypothetical protein